MQQRKPQVQSFHQSPQHFLLVSAQNIHHLTWTKAFKTLITKVKYHLWIKLFWILWRRSLRKNTNYCVLRTCYSQTLCSVSAPVPRIIISADQWSSIPVDLLPDGFVISQRTSNGGVILIHLDAMLGQFDLSDRQKMRPQLCQMRWCLYHELWFGQLETKR